MTFCILKYRHFTLPPLAAVAWNVVLLFVAYGLTRVAFLMENAENYAHLNSADSLTGIAHGALLFDASAIAYTNALYVLLVLLPLHLKERAAWYRCCQWLYMAVNALALAVNLADSVYFQYTSRRTTSAIFSEFSGDEQLGRIVGIELVSHWYLVLLWVALLWLLWAAYAHPRPSAAPLRRYYLQRTGELLLAALLCWGAMRGGFWDERPIKISTANQYIVRPNDASLILNTPFSLIRTIGKASYPQPKWFAADELERIYSPIHRPVRAAASPADSTSLSAEDAPLLAKRNVVVLFLESFGREYFGSLNRRLLPGYEGYTPFLDSLMERSVTFEYTTCSGRASVDAMPSALSGLPMMVESFVAGSHSVNRLHGLAYYLGQMGYESAFFHGAPATSLGFQGFTKSTGFQQCWSQEDYEADPRNGGRDDSDHWWGIWDEPFLQYFRMKLSDMHQPFLGTLFTLSSHHPFHIPEQYKERFPEGQLPIHKCIRYTDYALSRFFHEAEKEPWYENTIFVLTGDHPNLSCQPLYRTGVNKMSTSIIFFDPSQQLKPGMRPGIAQQTDILPTLLGLLGCDQPYMAFGKDLFRTAPEDTWAVNYFDGVYQLVRGGYLLQFNGEQTFGLYRIDDYALTRNLVGQVPEQAQMERFLKAVIQQYMDRMVENRLTPNE